MKKLKKLFAILIAMVAVLAMGTTVFAADITINGGAEGSEYAAYKLLNATDGGEGKIAYTVNEKYADALQEVTGKEAEQDIVAYIADLDAEGIRQFADSVYAKVAEQDADYTTATDEFAGIDQGYYLIVETKTGDDGDTYSLVMLDTAGKDAVTVTTKEEVPSLEKKVKETNDSTGNVTDWQDGADYDIGDAVPFKLTGTLPVNTYANYKTYYYSFKDTLSAGLTLDETSIVVKVDDTVLDASNYTVVVNGSSFEIQFEDLKQIAAVNGNSVITAEYNAVLNENAVIGVEGNPNVATLEYSNNPYGEGTGETPEDKVVVFTYEVTANKVDGDGNALEGAGFTLYKWDAATSAYVAVDDEITGVTRFEFTGVDAGQYKLVETTVPDGYNKAEDLIFTVEAVYDTESDDPQLTDLTVKDENGTVISGDTLTFTAVLASGTVTTDVVNQSGVELPSTGGIGTKIFYTVGAILMIAAAVLLITRKRSTSK